MDTSELLGNNDNIASSYNENVTVTVLSNCEHCFFVTSISQTSLNFKFFEHHNYATDNSNTMCRWAKCHDFTQC